MAITGQVKYFTSLPRHYYIDSEVFQQEVDKVFLQQWHYYAHGSELPNIGDYIKQQIFGESIVVVRGAEGRLHGFLNVCRHRGYQFCEQRAGSVSRFVCPYHRWTYDLGGHLIAAPSLSDGDFISYSEWGLHPVRVEEWHGFAFINFSHGAVEPISRALEQHAPGLLRLQPERLKKIAEVSYDIDANWKLFLENYLECYHCRGSHPEFCVTLDVARQYQDLLMERNAIGEYNGGTLMLKRGMKTLSSDGELVSVPLGEFAGTQSLPDAFSVGFSIQPALSRISFHVDYGVVQTLRPIDVHHTQWITRWFVRGDAEEGRDYVVDNVVRIWDITNRQDVLLVEGTQRGVNSRWYVPGPLSPKREPAIRAALKTYLLMMEEGEPLGGQLKSEPAHT